MAMVGSVQALSLNKNTQKRDSSTRRKPNMKLGRSLTLSGAGTLRRAMAANSW